LWKYKKSPKARIVGDICGEILGDFWSFDFGD